MSDSDLASHSRENLAPVRSGHAGPGVAAAPRNGTGLVWLWFGMGLSLVIGTAGFVAWMFLVRPAEKVAGSLRDSVASALESITGQRFSISANTFTLQKSTITELNVVQRKTQTLIKLETAVFGSKATLILRGDFIVKAGFDLTKPFTVTVNDTTGEVTADFPPARVTSVEMKNYEVFYSDNGVINRITPEHQQMATQQMLAQARLDAEKSDIKQEAEAQLTQRLKDLLGRDAKKVVVPERAALP